MSSKFTSLLATMPVGLTKESGGPESPDEAQLEQDFGRLAYSFLQDRASGLLPYILGFEVVDREDDGSRAIGIFGFKIGSDYYYVPAFFVNNQIKGMDLLYSKRTNMFMPLRETWINYIVNRQTIQLGEGENDPKKVRKDFEQPRFDFMATPPRSPAGSQKMAAAIETIHDAFGTWNEMQQSMVDALEKDGEFQEAFAGAIARMSKDPLPFEKTADDSRLISWMREKGGPRAVNSLITTLTDNHGFAKAAMTFYPSVESLLISDFAAELAPEKQAAKVTVVTETSDYLDGKEKKRLIRDGFTIHDSRDDEEKSETYEIDYEKRFHSPDSSGLYDVLLRTGGTTQCWVFLPAGESKNDTCVVVEDADQHYFLAEPGAVFVRGDELRESEKSPYDDTISLDDMEIGKKYIMIDKKNCSTLPFTVKSVVAEDGKRVKMRVNWHDYPKVKRPTYGKDFDILHTNRYGGPIGGDVCCGEREYIQLADYENGALSFSGDDTIIVPSGWKAFKLNDKFGKSDEIDSYEARRVMEDMFQPGTLTDVMDALGKNAFHKLAVASDDGIEYYMRFDDDYVDGPPVNYKSAALKLVTKYALSVDDAETMLTEARDNFKSRRMVKMGQMVGVNMPPPPQQAEGVDQFTGATLIDPQVDQVQGNVVGAQPPQNSLQPGFNIGGEAQMDTEAAGLAQQAAGAGQKQVFDHSTIGGLARLYDSGAVIDTYVPDLMQALDRLGRILFLFYWKNEEFAERYGTEDLAEMEDMIRGVFKSYGDLVLKLRQKAIDSEDADSAVM